MITSLQKQKKKNLRAAKTLSPRTSSPYAHFNDKREIFPLKDRRRTWLQYVVFIIIIAKRERYFPDNIIVRPHPSTRTSRTDTLRNDVIRTARRDSRTDDDRCSGRDSSPFYIVWRAFVKVARKLRSMGTHTEYPERECPG